MERLESYINGVVMDVDKLKEKLEGLRVQLKQLLDNANAVAGAIQFGESILEDEDKAQTAQADENEVT